MLVAWSPRFELDTQYCRPNPRICIQQGALNFRVLLISSFVVKQRGIASDLEKIKTHPKRMQKACYNDGVQNEKGGQNASIAG